MARPEDEKLIKALLRRKLLKREDLASMSAKAKKSLTSNGITKTFIAEFKLDDVALARVIADEFSIPVIQSSERFAAISFPEFDRAFIDRYRIFPLILHKDEATVAVIDPPYEQVVEKLRKMFKRNILTVVVPLSLFESLSRSVEEKTEAVKPKAPKVNLEAIDVEARGRQWAETVEKSGELPNAATVLAKILESADNLAASDIHFEVTKDGFFLVRVRVDGVMQRAVTLPRTYVESLPRIIRQSSSVDAFKKNEVQEGRLVFPLQDKKINTRMNIIPTNTGERIVLRILSKQRQTLSLSELGMSSHDRESLKEMLESSSGVFLFAGPPGCGKTMTMYAALNHLNNTSRSIATLENPVEIELDGINQISIDDLRGSNHADLIRALMRQDVDILGIGEIHNQDEAEALIEVGSAGLTVLATVCAKDSIETILQIQNLGVKPEQLSLALRGIVAQRFVRRVCPDCTEKYRPKRELLHRVGLMHLSPTTDLIRGKGCKRCYGTGYSGKLPLFEILIINDALSSLIYRRSSYSELKTSAERIGFSSIYFDALRKLFGGYTTLEEVLRVQ